MSLVTDRLLQSHGVRAFVKTLEQKIPPLRAWHRFEYQEHFERQSPSRVRLFNGVYRTREEALAAVPKGLKIGYEALTHGARHAHETTLWPSDYPVLFWLSSLLVPETELFEVGGSVGKAYYGFQKYFPYPPGLRWTVCELAPVAALGEALAVERGAAALSFTTRMEEGSGARILMASGALQFLPQPLWEILGAFPVKPAHVLLNRVPLSSGPSFVTLHNIGETICAYQVWNEAEFRAQIDRMGFSVIDSWKVSDFSCYIPFHPERTIPAYTGMYLRLKAREINGISSD